MHSDRLQTALDRLEARRVEIERQIISDLESQFSLLENGIQTDSLTSPAAGATPEVFTAADNPTANDTHTTFCWSD